MNPILTMPLLLLQQKAIRKTDFKERRADTNPLFENSNIFKLADNIKIASCLLISYYVHNKLPYVFNNWFTFSSNFYQYGTSFATKVHLKVPSVKITSYGKGAITSMVIKTWNNIWKITKDILLN